MRFPVLGIFPNGSLEIAASPANLTLNTSVGLRDGYYKGLRIVDSRGRWSKVRGARKVHGIGRFGGYNLFLNQRIRVSLDIEDENLEAETEDVKRMVLADFSAWHGWSSRGDFDLLVSRVKAAKTVSALIQVLANMVK